MEKQLNNKLKTTARSMSNRQLKLIMRNSLNRESRQLAYGILINRNAFTRSPRR